MRDPNFVETRPVEFQYLGLGDETRDFREVWDYQREVHAKVAAHELGPQVLFVEHDPVYTAGRRTEDAQRPFDGTPVVDVDRGGLITYHGPGQLVGYPIVFLRRGVGVVDYVRRLEEAVIRYLASLGIESGRVRERTGVWLAATDTRPERKICAIGIRVSRQTTIHGFALNLSTDLAAFGNIVPCGIDDAGVTSVEQELGHAPSVEAAAHAMEPFLRELLRFEPFTEAPDIASTHASAHQVTHGLTS